TERIITVLAGEDGEGKTPAELAVIKLSSEERERGRRLVMCAFAICATAYGIPSIFYGDEAGLEGYHDPFFRRPFPWGC
ncbi:MAG: glycoside hydrolase family 13 protein, partial [Clostridia bacterium]|nr:glycoside hydrolase family 13 protein [Clostridia bacterium]